MIATTTLPLLTKPGLAGLGLLLLFVLALSLLGSLRSGLHLSGPAAPADRRQLSPAASRSDALVLWLAQGFGVGRIPLAPGTFGSVVGVVWMLALLATRSGWWYAVGSVAGVVLSVGLCTAAERLLGARDPGSVVLDEIAAVPLCFAGWIGYRLWQTNAMPPLEVLVSGRGWLLLLGGLAAFRLFDILKPWPVRQSQTLPRGWGVTIDDVLAAVYANVVWIPSVWLGWL